MVSYCLTHSAERRNPRRRLKTRRKDPKRVEICLYRPKGPFKTRDMARGGTSVLSIRNYEIAIINDYKRFLYTLLEIDKRLLTIL